MMRMAMAAVAVALAGTARAEVRTWTSRTGTTMEAELSKPGPAANGGEGEARSRASDGICNLFGKELRDARKKKVPVDALAGKTVGIYFSAHWCPPCRAFTPQLVAFHKEMAKQGKPFEVVFVSSDRDEAEMYGYMKEMEMPWPALKFGDRHVQQLKSKFGVKGIPMLVVVDAEGKLVTDAGRADVGRLGAKAFDGWK